MTAGKEARKGPDLLIENHLTHLLLTVLLLTEAGPAPKVTKLVIGTAEVLKCLKVSLCRKRCIEIGGLGQAEPMQDSAPKCLGQTWAQFRCMTTVPTGPT